MWGFFFLVFFFSSMAFQLRGKIKMRQQKNTPHWRIIKTKTICKFTEKWTEEPWQTQASSAANSVGDGFFSIQRNQDDTGSWPILVEECHSLSFSNVVLFFLFKKLHMKVCVLNHLSHLDEYKYFQFFKMDLISDNSINPWIQINSSTKRQCKPKFSK